MSAYQAQLQKQFTAVAATSSGSTPGACTLIANEYGNAYYWWYYAIPTSSCHAPEKLQ